MLTYFEAVTGTTHLLTDILGADSKSISVLLLQAELESVRPDSGNDELRLKVSALPLRLRIDQDIVTFLQAFLSEEPDSVITAAEPFEAEVLQNSANGMSSLYSAAPSLLWHTHI